MKGLEFAIIENGHGENDAGYNFAGYHFGTVDDKYKERVWMEFPLFCVLVKHPTEGYIMFDVGPGLGDESDRRPPSVMQSHPAFIKREEFIDERLKQLGLSVHDISTIVISHCHWDHYGGLELFKGTKAIKNVYMSERDFAAGLVATHRTAKAFSDLGYFKVNFEVEGVEYNLISEDMELAPGIDLIHLDGHTPGIIGMILHLESGVYIFPSDAINSSLNFGPPIIQPGLVYDTRAVVKTTERLRTLQKQYNAAIIFPHDPWQFNEIKKAPYFYK